MVKKQLNNLIKKTMGIAINNKGALIIIYLNLKFLLLKAFLPRAFIS
jgi:hypothetical protein